MAASLDNPEAMTGHWYESEKCGGRVVGKLTLHTHNDKRECHGQGRTAGSSIRTQRSPSQNVAMGLLGDIVVGELSPENPKDEENQDKIKQAARSDLGVL